MRTDEIRTYVSPDELSERVALKLGEALSAATRYRTTDTPFELGLAGGFIVTQIIPRLEGLISAGQVPPIAWDCLRVWWVDERFVCADSPDRNDTPAIRDLFHLFPQIQLRSMPADTGQGIEAAKDAFTQVWERDMGQRSFDLMVVGMGPDGHVASLFPYSGQLESPDTIIAVVDSPKPPPQRLTVSMSVLKQAHLTWVVTAGLSKAKAVESALEKQADLHQIPVSALRGPHTTWWLDTAAATYLSVD